MGPRNQFDISDRVEIGGVEITRVNCIYYWHSYYEYVMHFAALIQFSIFC